MKAIICILFLLLAAPTHAANKIKIEKTKGRRAIVVLPPEFPTKAGDVYYISEDDPSLATDVMPLKGDLHPRNQRIGISFDFMNNETEIEDSDTKTELTQIDLELIWGWNRKFYEVGPLLSYSSTDQDDSKSTLWGLGGFAEYNFMQNIPGQKFVPAAGASFVYQFGDQQTTGFDEQEITVQDFKIYGALKLFPWGGGIALIPELGYNLKKTEVSIPGDTQKSETTGFYIAAGISGYIEDILAW